jgi:hypothetical protein
MARVLPLLIVAAATLLLTSIKSSTALKMASPGCRETCGNLTIPYPFGIGPGCYYKQGFDVSCEDNRTFMPNSSSRIQVYNISLLGGQIQVSTLIASKCNYTNGESTDGWVSVFTTPFFTLSSKANKLTAVGCNTVAFLGGYNKRRAQTGCVSLCLDKESVDFSGQCSGMGCCQTAIAPNLGSLNITFDKSFNNYVVNEFNPCSYAFVAEQDWFRFEASYLQDKKLTDKYKDGVPSVFDWVAGNQPCDEAVKNISSYACISRNSQCFNSPNVTGYLCSCSDGFEGNPYLADGCQGSQLCRIHFFTYTSNYLFTDLTFLLLFGVYRYRRMPTSTSVSVLRNLQ